MANKEALVQQVKNIQRSDPDSKQAWWDYCDANLGGVKDPNRHEAETLSEFLAAYSGAGATPAAQRRITPQTTTPMAGRSPAAATAVWNPAWPCPAAATPWTGGCAGWAGAGWAAQTAACGGCGGSPLAEFVKTGQRHSQQWKSSWQAYCAIYGQGFFDPSKYDEAFITAFIEYVGGLALVDLTNTAAEQGVTLDAGGAYTAGCGGLKRPMPALAGGQPPAKRQAVGPSGYDAWHAGGAGVAAGADAEKDELVAKVKAFQRQGDESKAAWWKFCDESLGGVKDPNRHDKEILQQFLASLAV